ncbi:hypothetical protein [Paractinoplanes toevensis]|uniref:hypothetical protein n=1 Tax=Paractinoplanes toevensis TaxID=571911 RepID=UPI001BB3EDD9|nr:hypothetical protein [Actinoplanes toevensis]
MPPLLLVTAALLALGPIQAHLIDQVQHQIYLTPAGGELGIELDLTPGALVGGGLQPLQHLVGAGFAGGIGRHPGARCRYPGRVVAALGFRAAVPHSGRMPHAGPQVPGKNDMPLISSACAAAPLEH